jgi:hypothetical protein
MKTIFNLFEVTDDNQKAELLAKAEEAGLTSVWGKFRPTKS